MSEIVFILGAGASADAGAPLMKNFMLKAQELRKEKDKVKIRQDFDDVFRIKNSISKLCHKSILDLNNVEELFAILEMGKLINKLVDLDSESIEKCTSSLRKVIGRTLELSMPLRMVSRDELDVYKTYNKFLKLLDLLKRHRRISCSVLTFNYDIGLDYTFYRNGLGFDYCLEDNSNSQLIAVLKLHGSLNWAKCTSCDKVIPWNFKDFIINESIGNDWIIDISSKLSSSGLCCPQCQNILSSDSFIIPPTWNKILHNKNLINVWKKAAKELSDAESIIIVGYSNPETDQYFKYLLSLGIEGETMIKNFWIIDPDAAVVEKFRKICGYGIQRIDNIEVGFDKGIEIVAQKFGIGKESLK